MEWKIRRKRLEEISLAGRKRLVQKRREDASALPKLTREQSDVSLDCARSAMRPHIAFTTSSVAYVNRRDYSSAACAAANRAMGIRNGLQLTYSRPSR
jgi:hypothetical protein